MLSEAVFLTVPVFVWSCVAVLAAACVFVIQSNMRR